MAYVENPKGYIVFDCDGTLISSQESLYEGVQYVISRLLGRDISRDEVVSKYSGDVYQVALNFGLDPGKDPALKDKMLSTWKEFAKANANGFRLFPGIKKLLLELLSDGYALYVWTARDRRSTTHILKELGVLSLFLEMRCLDDCDPKPNPRGLIEMLGDVQRDQVLVIGDSSADLLGAQKFGAHSVAACWASSQLNDYLAAYGPSGLANSPRDCVELIKKLIK